MRLTLGATPINEWAMTLLHVAVDEKKLDVRLIEKNLATSVLSAAEVDKAVQQLADDSENAEWVSVESLANEGEPSSGRA